jgi:ketopantoate reductase
MKIIVSNTGNVTIGLEDGESKETIAQVIDELKNAGITVHITSAVEQHRHDVDRVERSENVQS